jgi:hypothetical protein
MASIGVDHEHNGQDKFEHGYADNAGWVDMNNSYSSSQNQSPIYENGSYMLPFQHQSLPTESSFPPPRMHSQNPPSHYSTHQQLLPLIMPNHSQTTWPSMLTHPVTSSNPPVAISPAPAQPPQAKGNPPKLPAIHTGPSPRKTLTDSDRRRMCQYHEENPSVKQTEIGGKRATLVLLEGKCTDTV